MSPASAEVKSTIEYLVATSRINRRFWAPGKEYNTGIYAPHEVTIRNARLAGPFTLDSHGFCIGHDPTDITDWERNYGPESRYAAQVCEVAKRLSGADVAIPMGGMLRTSGTLAWRCPHTAFRDTTRPDAKQRRSIEFRAIAYFMGS
jgi:hypothetical protein